MAACGHLIHSESKDGGKSHGGSKGDGSGHGAQRHCGGEAAPAARRGGLGLRYEKREDFNGALDELEKGGAHLLLNEKHPEEHLAGLDLLVVSPGVPVEHPAIEKAKALGVEVVGEIEYAYRESTGLLLAVTGTNGKTTTVTLLGEIFKNAGRTTHVVGNIGTPYSGAVPEMPAT